MDWNTRRFSLGWWIRMNEPLPAQFLNVPSLLERSRPRVPAVRLWQVAGVFMIVVMISAYLNNQTGQAQQVMSVLSALMMFLLIGALGALSWITIRRVRGEQMQLEAVEELVRLRRWPEAAMLLEQMLGRPMRTPPARVQALIFLTTVLARYNRFDDAIAVQNYLLDEIPLDGSTSHGLRVARAMAMLREDHLFDADRAINELRQQVNRAGRAMNEQREARGEGLIVPEAPQSLSSGLALVEMYRDVKTGHPSEAIELFNNSLVAMRQQLGHRIADAHILIARAYDLLGQSPEAQDHFEKATLLAPVEELFRRYPETAALRAKFQPAEAPKELAA
jgi:tetratricopeptide (TPR) repeat protein